MNAVDYLFPRDLERTPTPIKRVLLIGSCLSDNYAEEFRALAPHVAFDRVLFNNAQDLPAEPPRPVGEYDLQYIQIPLRSVLSDAIVNANNLRDPAFLRQLLESAKRRLDAMLQAALLYNARSGLLTFVANFMTPQVRVAPSLSSQHTGADLSFAIQELNIHLGRRLHDYANVYYADVDALASSLGKRLFLDDSIYFYSHNSIVQPHYRDLDEDAFWTAPEPGRIEPIPPIDEIYINRPQAFFRAVYRQIVTGYRIAHQIDMVKLVIFDLDNTLWRGQIAEHYQPDLRPPPYDNWPVGMWEVVQQLRWRGILTSLASKNDHDLVVQKWEDAVPVPFLKFEDFVHPQIGWRPKAESVAAILKAVNVTAKSAVFVDDNPVERESVQAAFPEIRTLGANPFLTRRILLWSAETQVPTLTDESAKREEMIRGQIERDTQMATTSREDFLSGLGCRVTFQDVTGPAHPAFTRALELINKSNQFNTTGERQSAASIREFLLDGRLVAFWVADRFVEYGLTGVMRVRGRAIEQFVMSCRVLGMDVERSAVALAVALVREGEPEAPVFARLIETPSNGPCRDLYAKLGFRRREDDPTRFELVAGAALDPAPHIVSDWKMPAPAQAPAAAPRARDWVEASAPPQAEALDGAELTEGGRGWTIPPGRRGALTYQRFLVPIADAAALAGELGEFEIELATSDDILDHLAFQTDFATRYSNVGRPGTVLDSAVRANGRDGLLFTWRYVFSGAERCVVAALQVAEGAALERPAHLSLKRQRYRIRDGVSL